ncbi:hypothetical protein [Marinobacter salarius]|uniref:hypothetical protein n=1 Tax=Marinobacter salarius TaxID=1420917 RepID=UPI00241D99E1|nr:hypothetical protein [Marinobacter salarius]
MSDLHPDKGKRGGRCNVTACQQPGAWYFNKSTRAYYCENCAREINWPGGRADCMELYGVPMLCELDCSELYQRQIAECDDKLMHKVWDGTPWMIDAYTGGMARGDERYREIMEWCRDQFGPEAWPIHGKPGDWHCGGATVMGWTWLGFATKEMMDKFAAAWPVPDEVTKI